MILHFLIETCILCNETVPSKWPNWVRNDSITCSFIKNNKTKIVLPSLLKWKLWTKGDKQLWKYLVWSFGELKSVNYSLKHIFWNGEHQVSYCKRTNNSEIQIKIVCCNRRIKIKQPKSIPKPPSLLEQP